MNHTPTTRRKHQLPVELWGRVASFLPAFASQVLRGVSSTVRNVSNTPLVCNSWLSQFSSTEPVHEGAAAAQRLSSVLKEFPSSCFSPTHTDSTTVSPWEGPGRFALICARLGFDTAIERVVRCDPRILELRSLDKSTKTPLLTACAHGRSEVVRLLLKLGANPSTPEAYFKQDALSIAAGKGHEKMVALLLQHSLSRVELSQLRYNQPRPAKVNVFAVDKDGWDAVQIAEAKGHQAISEMILQKQHELRAL